MQIPELLFLMTNHFIDLGRIVANYNILGTATRPRHVVASRQNNVTILMQLVAAWQSPWNWQYCYIKKIATKFSEKPFQLQTLCLKTFRKDVSVCVCLVGLSVEFLATILSNSIILK